mmetsp:Transcript_108347/g.258542  ORF Transcript_108347/g.258542 Transcript_108347/m.258542 type:complete len:456 (-) Transcript_108347:627-1994(-)
MQSGLLLLLCQHTWLLCLGSHRSVLCVGPLGRLCLLLLLLQLLSRSCLSACILCQHLFRVFFFLCPCSQQSCTLRWVFELDVLDMPALEILLPLLPLLFEPLTGLQVINARGDLVLLNPLAHMALYCLLWLPGELNFVKAFLYFWNTETWKAGIEGHGNNIGQGIWLGLLEELLLLCFCKLNAWQLHIIIFCLLFHCLDFLACGLLLLLPSCPFGLLSLHFQELQLRLMLLLLLKLGLSPLLLLAPQLLVDVCQVFCAGLSNKHLGNPSEVRQPKPRQRLHPLLPQEIVPHLEEQDISLLRRSRSLQDLLHAAVIQVRQAKIHLGPVVGSLRGSLWPIDSASHGPVNNHSLTELCVMWIAPQKPVSPIKSAFIGQANGEDNLVLAIAGRLCGNLYVFQCRLLNHCALEWQGHVRSRPEINMHIHVFVGERWVQRLATKGLWQLLRICQALAIFEE